jgi:hypothetical protein
MALQISIDGAQLCSNQPSEAWVFIWVCYKKCFVIPGVIVPGPNNPEDINCSYSLLLLMWLLECEGLRIYDASVDSYIAQSLLVIIYTTADSLGSAFMSGMVSHSRKFGCHLYGNITSQNCKGNGHYYPAMHLPQDYTLAGSCHPDINNTDLVKY